MASFSVVVNSIVRLVLLLMPSFSVVINGIVSVVTNSIVTVVGIVIVVI